jgi:hypothetical protein
MQKKQNKTKQMNVLRLLIKCNSQSRVDFEQRMDDFVLTPPQVKNQGFICFNDQQNHALLLK